MQNFSFHNPDKVTYFAETDYRGKRTPFGIKASDRTRHMYVIGKTGMGKSTLLENMAVQDIRNGEGLAFIDPHGGTAEKLLEYIPEHRLDDVVYFAPFDTDHPIGFNVMEDVGYDKRHLVANGLMSAFKKIWVDAWSARMEYILNNTILALLEYPDSTILSVNKMLVDKHYRKKVVDNVTDPSVRSFWKDEFAKYTDRYAQEATPAILNKVGQFISNPLIRNIIGQPKSAFDIREMMDNKKILIMNLSKGRMGEQNANLIGSMLVTKVYLAAMSRADAPSDVLAKLPNFYFYVDEFQSFANESFADILSEARKYKLNLLIAHQYIEQMPEEVRAAVFGNVGTMIVFRVGSYDAEIFEKEFAPRFTAEDIVNLGFAQIYLRLMIDGLSSQPFSAVTLPPIPTPEYDLKQDVIDHSRKNYAYHREEVERQIREWHEESHEPEQEVPRAARKPLSPPYSREAHDIRPRPQTTHAPRYTPQQNDRSFSERSAPVRDHGYEQRTHSPRAERPSYSERSRVDERPRIPVPDRSPRERPEPKEAGAPEHMSVEEKTVSLKEAIFAAMTEKTVRVEKEERATPEHVSESRQREEPEREKKAPRPQPVEEKVYSLKDALAQAVQEHKVREGNSPQTSPEDRRSTAPHGDTQQNSEEAHRFERESGRGTRHDQHDQRRYDRRQEDRRAPREDVRSSRHEEERSHEVKKQPEQASSHEQKRPSHPGEIPKDVLERMLRVGGDEK